MKEHDAGKTHRALGWGAVGGFVVGLFSPPLLAATAVGAAAGGVLHELAKHHDEKKLGSEVEDYLPVGSSAIIAIVDDTVGEMVVGLRAGDLRLSAADERVLRIVAPLLAQTLRARSLAEDLRTSRGEAVTATLPLP